ncbi:MAG: hypothetical protein Q7S21_01710 [archaeon]|nr:hypothetical protein [archaeon]
MAVAPEIIVYIAAASVILFILILSLIRMSNKIVSRKLDENNERVSHLEKIAKHHSKLLTIENMKLRHRVHELEKHVEKAERVEETEQIVEKAIDRMRKQK